MNASRWSLSTTNPEESSHEPRPNREARKVDGRLTAASSLRSRRVASPRRPAAATAAYVPGGRGGVRQRARRHCLAWNLTSNNDSAVTVEPPASTPDGNHHDDGRASREDRRQSRHTIRLGYRSPYPRRRSHSAAIGFGSNRADWRRRVRSADVATGRDSADRPPRTPACDKPGRDLGADRPRQRPRHKSAASDRADQTRRTSTSTSPATCPSRSLIARTRVSVFRGGSRHSMGRARRPCCDSMLAPTR